MGLKLRFQLLMLSVLLLPLLPLSAQISPSSELDILDQEHRKDSLKEFALEEIAEGEYQEALDHLNAALSLSPEDLELQDLKKSVVDLILLEEDYGDRGDIDPEDPNFSDFQTADEDAVISPDFAEELLTDAQKTDPTIKRNAFSLEIGNAYGQTQPLYLTDTRVLVGSDSIPDNPYYRISLDAEAFFFKNKRNLGLAVHYKDVPYNHNDVDMLERVFDMTVHYRGFFAETMESRLILGAKVGAGFLGIKEDLDEDDIADGDISNPTMYIAGVYFSDALFRYLFKNGLFFKRFVIEMKFDFIFVSSLDDVNLSQYSISGGYQFSDHIGISVYSEAFNTSTSLQNTSSWELGGRFKLSY